MSHPDTRHFYYLWFIYIAGDGLGYGLGIGFLSYTEIGSRDVGLCNANMFCIVQCRHWVRNLNPILYPSQSPTV